VTLGSDFPTFSVDAVKIGPGKALKERAGAKPWDARKRKGDTAGGCTDHHLCGKQELKGLEDLARDAKVPVASEKNCIATRRR
jgi:hypothetical protein